MHRRGALPHNGGFACIGRPRPHVPEKTAMIKVEGVSKRYGSTRAVRNISFEVRRGEIVGFLGPNGAGKTTTMRILTGFLPPTEGRAIVAGYDVAEDPLEVKKRIGYLPENPPVYPEMDVEGYLRFVARLNAGGESGSAGDQRTPP